MSGPPLRAVFEAFGRDSVQYDCPLYARLAMAVAEDAELQALAALVEHRPLANVFFGAVHFLLLRGADHPLAEYYGSLHGSPDRVSDPFPAFKDFCAEHRAELEPLLRTRYVQTNEVRRCAYLLPAFAEVHARGAERPLALVELGTSAGLNLLCDRYHFDYGAGREWGPADATVQLTCEVRGAHSPPVPASDAPIGARVGIDLHPVDLGDADDRLWLFALVWPDHGPRVERLAAAVTAAERSDRTLVRGDASEFPQQVVDQCPQDQTLCVFHSAALIQFSSAARTRLEDRLREISLSRVVYRVSAEEDDFSLREYRGGEGAREPLGSFDSHGRWVEWILH